MDNLLEVKNLETSFFTHVGEVKAVRNVSFNVRKKEIVGIVGESGSGKSVTSLSIMQLLQNPGRVKSGQIIYKGEDLLKMTPAQMNKVRGKEISMVFQDPMVSLNPIYTIGTQISEMINNHYKWSKEDVKKRVIKMLELVKIPDAEKRYNCYPHEFSGGMRQRAMIAMALACDPSLVIADEPTTALDVTIQSQILYLLKEINKEMDTSVILITHDLGVVADVCDRVIVMYGGVILEEGLLDEIFYSPAHPYTMGLLKSIPKITYGKREKLVPIVGTPPDLFAPPTGCPFYSRCKYAMKICNKRMPPFFELSDEHRSACWKLCDAAPIDEDYQKNRVGIRYGK